MEEVFRGFFAENHANLSPKGVYTDAVPACPKEIFGGEVKNFFFEQEGQGEPSGTTSHPVRSGNRFPRTPGWFVKSKAKSKGNTV